MMRIADSDVSDAIDPRRPDAIFAESVRLFRLWYPEAAFAPVAAAYTLTTRLYTGYYPGYRACNTDYHDFAHTLDILLATARLLDGWALDTLAPPADLAADLLIAALLHDAGYIQKSDDAEGTGAKYTRDHVRRSADFILAEAAVFGLAPGRAARVSRLIECTDIRLVPADIPYPDGAEAHAGALLATADLLGQMANRAYLEKLLFLYYEFREAGFPNYQTEFDILRNTLAFYDSTRARLERGLGDLRRYSRRHFAARFGLDRDLYQESIDRQMDYLRSIIADSSTNFRKKLRRMDLERLPARPA
jgi:hypothetical protein